MATQDESLSLSEPDTQFVEKEVEDDLWDVLAILDERAKQFLVKWVGTDPNTGEPWEPSWVPKHDCTPTLVMAWQKEKAEKKKAQAAERKAKASARAAAKGKGKGKANSSTGQTSSRTGPTATKRRTRTQSSRAPESVATNAVSAAGPAASRSRAPSVDVRIPQPASPRKRRRSSTAPKYAIRATDSYHTEDELEPPVPPRKKRKVDPAVAHPSTRAPAASESNRRVYGKSGAGRGGSVESEDELVEVEAGPSRIRRKPSETRSVAHSPPLPISRNVNGSRKDKGKAKQKALDDDEEHGTDYSAPPSPSTIAPRSIPADKLRMKEVRTDDDDGSSDLPKPVKPRARAPAKRVPASSPPEARDGTPNSETEDDDEVVDARARRRGKQNGNAKISHGRSPAEPSDADSEPKRAPKLKAKPPLKPKPAAPVSAPNHAPTIASMPKGKRPRVRHPLAEEEEESQSQHAIPVPAPAVPPRSFYAPHPPSEGARTDLNSDSGPGDGNDGGDDGDHLFDGGPAMYSDEDEIGEIAQYGDDHHAPLPPVPLSPPAVLGVDIGRHSRHDSIVPETVLDSQSQPLSRPLHTPEKQPARERELPVTPSSLRKGASLIERMKDRTGSVSPRQVRLRRAATEITLDDTHALPAALLPLFDASPQASSSPARPRGRSPPQSIIRRRGSSTSTSGASRAVSPVARTSGSGAAHPVKAKRAVKPIQQMSPSKFKPYLPAPAADVDAPMSSIEQFSSPEKAGGAPRPSRDTVEDADASASAEINRDDFAPPVTQWSDEKLRQRGEHLAMLHARAKRARGEERPRAKRTLHLLPDGNRGQRGSSAEPGQPVNGIAEHLNGLGDSASFTEQTALEHGEHEGDAVLSGDDIRKREDEIFKVVEDEPSSPAGARAEGPDPDEEIAEEEEIAASLDPRDESMDTVQHSSVVVEVEAVEDSSQTALADASMEALPPTASSRFKPSQPSASSIPLRPSDDFAIVIEEALASDRPHLAQDNDGARSPLEIKAQPTEEIHQTLMDTLKIRDDEWAAKLATATADITIQRARLAELEQERNTATARAVQLDSAREDAEKQSALFRDMYGKASAFAGEVRAEASVKTERIAVLEGQLAVGLVGMRAALEGRIAALEAQLRTAAARAAMLEERERRTGADELRRRAAREPDVSAENARLKRALAKAEREAEEWKALVEAMEDGSFHGSDDEQAPQAPVPVQVNGSVSSELVPGLVAPPMDTDAPAPPVYAPDPADQQMVHFCQFRVPGAAKVCAETFVSREALVVHAISQGHLGHARTV